LWALPLVAAIAAALAAAVSPAAWQAFAVHPQVPGGMFLALWTGTVALILALTLAVMITMALYATRLWRHVPLFTGAALAIPHLAFAIGFSFLVMPSGVVARLVVGGETPPAWTTVQDPYGAALIAVLVLKETPFLVLMAWSVLAQGDAASRFAGEVKAARSLGHGMTSVWCRVLLPQLAKRLLWPIVIVWVYGVTVVDLAMVIGPTQPPTVASVTWSDLNDADQAINGRGAAGAVALVVVLAVLATMVVLFARPALPMLRNYFTRGPKGDAGAFRMFGVSVCAAIAVIYILVLLSLLLLSLSPLWPYPALIAEDMNFTAWRGIAAAPMLFSLGLALTTAAVAAVLIVLWFESVPQHVDRILLGLALLALALPQVTLAAGQYRLFLHLGATGTLAGLFFVHLTPVLAYGFIVLAGPYRNFDGRFAAAARALGASPWRVWREVKLPLLKAPLLTMLAVGVSASLVQFVPAQLMAAGRFATLPMEAVTLASGGNRALTAAHALALTVPAVIAFAAASFLGRPRWR
jgi:putative thiamine transport system permease protein